MPIILKIRLRKCRCVCRTPRKHHDSVGKQLLDWNPQGARRRGRQKQASKKTVLKETGKCGKTWNEVKRLANNRGRWKCCTNALNF